MRKIEVEAMKTQEKSDIIERGILYNLLNYGLEDTYTYFKDESLDMELLKDLLSKNILFIKKTTDELSFTKEMKNAKQSELDLIKAINTSYKNIAFVLSSPKNLKFDIFLNNDESFYLLSSLLRVLHTLCDKLKLHHLEKTGIANIFLLFFDQRSKKDIYKFILITSLITIQDLDFWFLRYIRDDEYFFYFDKEYFIFISMYINYFFGEQKINKKFSKSSDITLFLHEESSAMNNGKLSWNRMLHSVLSRYNTKEALDMFKKFDIMFSSMPDNLLDIPLERIGYIFYNGNYSFSKMKAYDMWLQIILNSDIFYFSETEIDDYFSKNSIPQELEIFLQNNFIKNNRKFENNFLSFFELPINSNKILIDQKINYFTNAVNKQGRKILLNEGKDSNNSFDVTNIISGLVNGIKNVEHPIVKIDLQKDHPNTSKYIIRTEKDASTNEIVPELSKAVGKDIFDSLVFLLFKNYGNIKSIKGYALDDNEILKILDFNPTCRINGYQILYNNSFSSEIIEKLRKIQVCNISYVRDAIFWKNDAVKIKFNISEKEALPLELSDGEISQIIDRKYPCINGLYAYEEKGTRAFLTREELSKKLKKRYINIVLTYHYSVYLNQSNLLYYRFKDTFA